MTEQEKPFPVLGYSKYSDCPTSVNWSELDEMWAKRVHSQTLERLAERGGLSPVEIVFNVNKLKWATPVNPEFALDLVRGIAYVDKPAMKDKEAINAIRKSIYLTQEGSNDEHSWLWCQDKVGDDDIKYIRADLCTQYQDEWISMESAPKDGTVFQAFHKIHNVPIAVRFMDKKNTLDEQDKWIEKTLTTMWPIDSFVGWKPLPQPPTSNNETPGL